MLCYCNKCGNICEAFQDEIERGDGCYCCNNAPLIPIPREYINNFRWRDGNGKQAFLEEVIKKSPNLDPYHFEHRNEIIKQKNDLLDAATAHGKEILKEQSRVAHCPSCGSTNVSNVGTIGRMVSIGLFGLASSKIGKTHKCNNCGTTW